MAFTGATYSGQANRGIDRSFSIRRNDNGLLLSLGGRRASIEWSDKDSIEEIDGIDNGGLTDHVYHAGGLTGTVTINRFNGDFEAFSKAYNANYYTNGPTIYCTLVSTTNNNPLSGPSQDTDTFTMVVLGSLKSGPFENKRNPKVTFTFHAQQRV